MADTTEKTLEELRDEKCIPVARAILADLPTDMLGQDGTPLAVKMLTHVLETDMNIVTEVSYIPQLLLGGLSGLNAAVQAATKDPIDDGRYKAIAERMLRMLSDENLTLGNVTAEQMAIDQAPLVEKLGSLFAEEKLDSLETKYIMDSIFEAFASVSNMFSDSLSKSTEKATAKAFGIDNAKDLSTGKVNEMLLR